MKTFALALFAAGTSAFKMEFKYMQHLAEYGIDIPTIMNFSERLANFAATDAIIEEVNAREKNFQLGHNFMSDWSEEEKKVLRGAILDK